jgi:predicted nucleic acid-binding Zn ribbon protein
MGEQISSNTRLSSFEDGVLQVEASDERWLEELTRLSEEIRGRINKFFGKEVVRTVRFVQKS